MDRFSCVESDIGPVRRIIPLPTSGDKERKLRVARTAHMQYDGSDFRIAMNEINRVNRIETEFLEMLKTIGDDLDRGEF